MTSPPPFQIGSDFIATRISFLSLHCILKASKWKVVGREKFVKRRTMNQ
jgi:hypothetical protein